MARNNASAVINAMSSPDLLPGSASTALTDPPRLQTRSFATARTVLALMLREMSARYGRSPGGYLWALLEPLGAILLLSVAFSLISRHPSLGTSFVLFYATGYLPFSLYQSLSTVTARALGYSRALLLYPAVTWMDSVLARFILNTLTTVMISYILLSLIMLLTETRTVLEVGPILMAYAMAMVLGLGIGSLNCVLFGLFPAWEMVWSILSRPLFLASGILILYENMSVMLRNILWWNPLLHITGEMRKGFYPMYSASYSSPAYVFGIGLGLMALGFILLGRYHRDILNEM